MHSDMEYKSQIVYRGLSDWLSSTLNLSFSPVGFDEGKNSWYENTIGVVFSRTNHTNDVAVSDFRFIKLYHSFVSLNLLKGNNHE